MELRLASRLSLADTIAGLLVEAPAAGRGNQPLLNLIGPPGIGKSYTLGELYARLARSYAVAALDFAHPERTWAASADALAALLPPDGPTHSHPDLAPLALRLSCALPPSHGPGQPWLLLLDGLDDLQHWPIIQQALIKPVAERSLALVVVATRAPVTWHYWELGKRCRTMALPRLELEETIDIARSAARDPLGQPLHDLALGHPGAVEALLRHFTIAPPRDLPPPQIDALSEPTRRILGVVGPMRAVHPPTMQRLLARFLPGWEATVAADPRALDTALHELQAHGHLIDRGGDGWIISPALRAAVVALLERHRPERLAAISSELAASYFEAADAQPVAAARSLNEWLFFSAPSAERPGRELWLEQLRHLCARRLAHGGDDLPAQIYRDEELIERLQSAGCLDRVHELLRAQAPIGAAVFTQDAARYKAYANELLERLISSSSPAEGRRLRLLLDCAREVADPFEAIDLALITAEKGLTVHGVRRDLTLLGDRGCCVYDEPNRTYTLDPLVRRLLAAVDPLDDAQRHPPA